MAALNDEVLAHRLEREGAKSGDIQVSLIWGDIADLDLHAECPCGNHIYFGSKKCPTCGGWLDVDMNVSASDASLEPVENIHWEGNPPPGKYKFWVNNFNCHKARRGILDFTDNSRQVAFRCVLKRSNFADKSATGSVTHKKDHTVFEFELADTPLEGDVELSVCYANYQTLKPDDTLEVAVTVKIPNSKWNWLLGDPSSYIIYDSNKHFQASKEFLHNQNSVTLRLKPRSKADIFTLPSSLRFRLVTAEREMRNVHFAVSLDVFTRELIQPNPDGKPRNILLFGLAGGGKSALINAAYTMLSETVISQMAISGGAEGHVTTTFKGYGLAAFDMDRVVKTRARFNVFDTWGLEDQTYNEGEFERILRGGMVKDANMSDRAPLFDALVNDPNREIAAVIFCLPVAEVDQNSDMLLKLKRYVEKAVRMDRSFLVAITQCDKLAFGFPSTRAEIPSNLEEKLREAGRLLNTERARIFPTVAYTADKHKNVDIDRLSYALFEQAVQLADSYHWRNNSDAISSLLF